MRISSKLLAFLCLCGVTVGFEPPSARADAQVFPADRQEIEDLISTYSQAYDSRDVDTVLKLFTEDAVIEIYARGATTPLASLSGKSALRAAMTQRLASFADRRVQSRHYQTNTLLVPLADGVVNGTTLLNMVWQVADERPLSMATGLYADVFVKTDGRWKFARRTLLLDQDSLPALPGGPARE